VAQQLDGVDVSRSADLALRLSVTGTAEVSGALDKTRDRLGDVKEEAGRLADKAQSVFSSLRNMAAALGLAISVKEFVEAADMMTLLGARLKLAAGNAAEFGRAQAEVYRIAQANNVGLKETTELYTKLANPVQRLGGTTREVGAIVDSFATSLRVGGASTQEAAAATLQFAQAMGSGRLQGDEFRSLAEASPRFMRALAEGMGLPIESLKKMGSEGQLTADVVGNALIASLGQLKQEAAALPDTVGGALTRLKNDVLVAIDDINKSSGLTLGLAALVDTVDRELLPVIKIELKAAFEAVGKFIERNRDKLAEVWELSKSIAGDLWGVVKAVGSVVEFVADWALQSDQVKLCLEVVRLLIAGFKDGVVMIGASFAHVGSVILEALVWPLTTAGRVAAAIAGVFDKKLAAQITSAVDSVKEFVTAGQKYAAGVVKDFADGNSAVQALGREMDTSARKSAQAKEALAGSAISAKEAGGEMDRLAARANAAASGYVQLKSRVKEATEEDTKAIEATKKLIAQLESKQFENETEAAQQAKLTEGQKLALKAMESLRDGTIKATDSEKRRIVVLLETILRQEAATAAAKKASEEEERKTAAIKKAVEAEVKRAVALVDGNAKLQDEIDKLTLSKDELKRKTAAVLDDELAELRAAAARGEGSDALYAQIAALEERKVLLARKDVAEAAKAERDEWQKTADSINNSLTDALMRAFESGKGFAEAFKATLVNAFKTMILQPTIRGILAPVSGAIGTVFGGAASAGQPGIGAGAGGASLFDLSTYSRAYDAMTGGTAGAYTSFATSNLGQSIGLSQALPASAAEQAYIGSTGGVQMTGLGQSVGTWGGLAMGAIAGHYLGGAISGGYSAIGSSGNSAVNIGTAIGSIWGPIGAVVGGAIGGIVNRAFGMGSQESRGSGVSGEFSGGQFKGEQYQNWHRSGGWFRSDQDWTDKSPVDKQLQEMLSVGTAGVYARAKQYAAALGLPVRAMADVTTQMTVAFGSDEQANLKALAAAFDDYGNALLGPYAQQLAEVTRGNETLQQTMERLGGSLISVNAVLRTMGLHLADVSVAGGAAAADLLDLTGGLDAFLAKTQAYLQNYFSEAEQMGAASAAILAKLSAAGVDAAGFGRRSDLRAALEGLDINDAGQRQQAAALLNVASDYAKLADYLEKGGLTLAASAADAPAGFAPAQGTVDDLIDQGSTQTELAQRSADGIEQLGQTVRQMKDEIAVSVEGMWGSLETGMTAIAVNTRDMVGQLRMWDASGRLLTTDQP